MSDRSSGGRTVCRGPAPSGLGLFLIVAGLDGVALGLLMRYEGVLLYRGALLALAVLPFANVLLAAWRVGGERQRARPFRRGFLRAGAVVLAAILAATVIDPITLYVAILGAVRVALRLGPGHPLLSFQRPWHHWVVSLSLLALGLVAATAGGVVASRRAGPSAPAAAFHPPNAA